MQLLNFFKKNRKKFCAFFTAITVMIGILVFFIIDIRPMSAQTCGGPTDLNQDCTVNNKKGICKPGMDSSYTICTPIDEKTGKPVENYEVSQLPKASGGLWDWIGNIAFSVVFKIVYAITYCIFYVFSLILALAGALLDFVLTKPELNKFALSPIVRTGWGITKNFANMFFALILLIISFATILRIESYGIKQVLPRLIIAALLINFSLVIGGVIIDFTQVMTKYFVDKALEGTNGQSLSATISQKLQVAQGILATKDEAKAPPISEAIDGSAAAIGGLFAGIIVILIAAFVFFAAAILFIVRYIALLFLLILAPLAWFFYIVPMTKKYWDMWWSTFFKYAFFAPAYAFFLYLSMIIIKSDVMTEVGVNSGGAAGGFGRYTIPMFINYTIIIGFLLGGLIVAQKLGVWGGGAMLGWVKSAGRGFGRMTGRWAARGAPMPKVVAPILRKVGLEKTATRWEKVMKYAGAPKRFVAPLMVPQVWKRALAAGRARSESQSYTKAAGRLEGLLSLSVNQAKMREEQAEALEVDKKETELRKTYRTEEKVLNALATTTNPVERQALLRIATSMNAINTYFASDTPTHKPEPFNPDSFRNFLQNLEGMSADARAKISSDISSIASSNGNFSLVGMTKWDPNQNKEVFASAAEQTKTALKKSMEMEHQQWARQIHPDSFFGRDAKGGYTVGLHAFGKQMVQNITGGHIKQVDRLQGRTLDALYKHESDIRAEATATGVTAAQADLINKFADAI